MKKLLLILFLLSFGLSLQAETNLVVWQKDGGKVTFVLTEKPKVQFFEKDFNVYSDTYAVTYKYEDVAKFTYEEAEQAGIKNLENDNESSFKFDGELMVFSSLEAGSAVAIRSLNGAIVFNKTIETAGDYSFPLTHLDKGVYLVTVHGLTYKIVKK